MKKALHVLLALGLFAVLIAAGCSSGGGGNGTTAAQGQNSVVVAQSAAPTSVCPTGGIEVDAGIDLNSNGILDGTPGSVNGEITSVQYVCNGENGSNGSDGTAVGVTITTEAAGTNCPNGGYKIEVGPDANGDGAPDTITSTDYVCNGTSVMSAGEACLTCHASGRSEAINTIHGGLHVDKPLATIDNVTVTPDGSGNVSLTIDFTVTNSSGGVIANLEEASQSNAARLGHLRFQMAKLIPGSVATGTYTTPNRWLAVGSSERTFASLTPGPGDGTYSYVTGTIPLVSTGTDTSTAYDDTLKTQVVMLVFPENGTLPLLSGLTNGVDAQFIIANGSTASQDVVPTANCLKCHDVFGNAELNPKAFHAEEGRVEVYSCQACHADNTKGRKLTAVVSGVTYTFDHTDEEIGYFAHAIHTSQTLAASRDFSGVTYPQDVRNCTTCHSGAADSNNWMVRPSAKGCLSCHNPGNPDFSTMVALTDPATSHSGGQIGPVGSGAACDDTMCAGCHKATTGMKPIVTAHLTPFKTTHNDGVTNAANFEYVISQVTLSADRTPVITFSILNNGTAVTLATGTTVTAPLAGFTGGPTLGVTFAAPEDGITNPADWNGSHNTTKLVNLADGSKGSLVDNLNGTYTANLLMNNPRGSAAAVSMAVPSSATMVTGFMSGSFTDSTWASLSSDPTGSVRVGIPSFKTADGNTERRKIFSKDKCNNCHERLGTVPNFHGGSYSVEICGVCHTPNGASGGWSYSFRTWVHGIHGAGKRTVPFTFAAASATESYADVEYPGVLSNCEECHLAGTYDFSDTGASTGVTGGYTDDLINNMLNVLNVSGTLSSTSTSSFDYPKLNGVVQYGIELDHDYGNNYSISSNGTITAGAGTNLVSSPITATCTACHDNNSGISHVKSQGGAFYNLRSLTPSPAH